MLVLLQAVFIAVQNAQMEIPQPLPSLQLAAGVKDVVHHAVHRALAPAGAPQLFPDDLDVEREIAAFTAEDMEALARQLEQELYDDVAQQIAEWQAQQEEALGRELDEQLGESFVGGLEGVKRGRPCVRGVAAGMMVALPP